MPSKAQLSTDWGETGGEILDAVDPLDMSGHGLMNTAPKHPLTEEDDELDAGSDLLLTNEDEDDYPPLLQSGRAAHTTWWVMLTHFGRRGFQPAGCV